MHFSLSRPLDEGMMEYARSDTHYLLYMAGRLRNMLSDQGLLEQALEICFELCMRVSVYLDFMIFTPPYPRHHMASQHFITFLTC